MTLKEKHSNLLGIITRLSYDQFLYGGEEISCNELISDIRHECPYITNTDLSPTTASEIHKFYNRVIEYFYEVERLLEVVSDKFAYENPHLLKQITNIKKRAIFECFIKKTAFYITIDDFSKSIIRDNTVTHNEIENLFNIFQNMYWFCRGMFTSEHTFFSPAFLEEEVA